MALPQGGERRKGRRKTKRRMKTRRSQLALRKGNKDQHQSSAHVYVTVLNNVCEECKTYALAHNPASGEALPSDLKLLVVGLISSGATRDTFIRYYCI